MHPEAEYLKWRVKTELPTTLVHDGTLTEEEVSKLKKGLPSSVSVIAFKDRQAISFDMAVVSLSPMFLWKSKEHVQWYANVLTSRTHLSDQWNFDTFPVL